MTLWQSNSSSMQSLERERRCNLDPRGLKPSGFAPEGEMAACLFASPYLVIGTGYETYISHILKVYRLYSSWVSEFGSASFQVRSSMLHTPKECRERGGACRGRICVACSQ